MALRQMGHSLIRSPHSWQVPWPHMKIMFFSRSRQTGHMVCREWGGGSSGWHRSVSVNTRTHQRSHLLLDVLQLLLQLLHVGVHVGVVFVSLQRRDVPACCVGTTTKDVFKKKSHSVTSLNKILTISPVATSNRTSS